MKIGKNKCFLQSINTILDVYTRNLKHENEISDYAFQTMMLMAEHYGEEKIEKEDAYWENINLNESDECFLSNAILNEIYFSTYSQMHQNAEQEYQKEQAEKQDLLKIFHTLLEYNDVCIYSKEHESKVKTLKSLELETVVKIPCWISKTIQGENNITVELKKYNFISIFPTNRGSEKKWNVTGTKGYSDLKLVISQKYGFYQEISVKGKKRLVPLAAKTLAAYYNKDNIVFTMFCEKICELFVKRNNLFAKDVFSYVKKGVFLPNLLINDIPKYTSFTHAFMRKYPTKQNWNKNDINVLYVIYNVSRYLDEPSKRMFAEYANEELVYDFLEKEERIRFFGKGCSNTIASFMSQYYSDKFILDLQKCPNDAVIIQDYINMCILTKTKISVKIKNINGMRKKHDDIMIKQHEKNTPKIKIPKNSKYNKLRKLLPANFERIDTKKRILEESIMQHNCVWSYAKYINQDECAIYSLCSPTDGKRYTIEFYFLEKKEEYGILQLEGPCNSGCSEAIYDYVSSFLQ